MNARCFSAEYLLNRLREISNEHANARALSSVEAKDLLILIEEAKTQLANPASK